MPCWPVSYRDGTYQVTDNDGILYPITMGRSPVGSLDPGWVPVGLQTGLKPFHMLELRNEELSSDAVWYLGDELDFLTHTARNFDPQQAALVVSSLSPLLHDIYDESLCAPQPGVAGSSHDFDGINPAFVREIIEFVVGSALTPPDVVPMRQLDGAGGQHVAGGVRFSTSLLRHCLDITAPEPGHSSGSVTLASPFDATLLTAQERFAPAGGALAQVHRFYDPAGPMALYLVFARESDAPALYIPVANTVFATGDGLSGAQVMTALFTHYASHTDRIIPADGTASAVDAQPAADPAPLEGERRLAGPEAPAAGEDPTAIEPEAPTQHGTWWKRLFGLGHS